MKIVLTTDGSEYSEGAAECLTRLELTADDEITIVHVIDWPPLHYDEESYFTRFNQVRRDIAPRILEVIEEILSGVDAKINPLIIDGHPGEAIVDLVASLGADLVVMGARGPKEIKSHVVGSVTKTVAVKSQSPVLIVKPPLQKRTGRMKILFATDGSDHSEAAGRLLTRIPFPKETEVTILNILWSPTHDLPERLALEMDERLKDIVADTRSREFVESEKLIKKTHEYLNKRFSDIHGLTKVGDPAIEILNAAAALNTDIIAVGSRGLRKIKGMLGSVSRNILNHSRCSVLIGKV
jgi:nucleotide-binding universal stress UspA family protein